MDTIVFVKSVEIRRQRRNKICQIVFVKNAASQWMKDSFIPTKVERKLNFVKNV